MSKVKAPRDIVKKCSRFNGYYRSQDTVFVEMATPHHGTNDPQGISLFLASLSHCAEYTRYGKFTGLEI
jgi:hypothetical protein